MPPSPPRRPRLGEILLGRGLVSDGQLRMALGEQARWGGHLGRMLVDLGIIREEILVAALSEQLDVPSVDLRGRAIAQSTLDLIPIETAQQLQVLPLADDGFHLEVAVADPGNTGTIEHVRMLTRRRKLTVYIAGPRALVDAIGRHYRAVVDNAFGRAPLSFAAGPPTVQAAGPVSPLRSPALTPHPEFSFPGGSGPRTVVPGAAPGPSPGGGLAHLDDANVSLRDAFLGLEEERAREIQALQGRVVQLEGLLARDEEVIRKLCALLVRKKVCTRDEIVEALR